MLSVLAARHAESASLTVCCWLEKGWVGIPKPLHPFVTEFFFLLLPEEYKQISLTRRGREQKMNEETGLGWVKVNVWFVGVGVTQSTIGCCVIPKVFLGEYNGPFRLHSVPRSSSLAPEVLYFVRRTAARLCLSPSAFWLAWHAWEGHEHWLFQTEPGMLSDGRIVYWRRGGTKSIKRARSQRWLWKHPETVFKENKHLCSMWIITKISKSMAFVVKCSTHWARMGSM